MVPAYVRSKTSASRPQSTSAPSCSSDSLLNVSKTASSAFRTSRTACRRWPSSTPCARSFCRSESSAPATRGSSGASRAWRTGSKRVGKRGQSDRALQALDKFRLALLQDALNLNGKDISGNFAFVNTGEMDWVDPVIAVRMTHGFGNGRSITAMGDVGGFNTDRDFSWQVLLTYDWTANSSVSIRRPPSATRRSGSCSRKPPAMARAASTSCCTAPSPS